MFGHYSPAQRVSFEILSFLDKNTNILLASHGNEITITRANDGALIARVFVNEYDPLGDKHMMQVSVDGVNFAQCSYSFNAAQSIVRSKNYPATADKSHRERARNYSKAVYNEVAF